MTDGKDDIFTHVYLDNLYGRQEWFLKIRNYLEIRYPPIVDRLKNSFRYVDLHPINSKTVSYEFASILRDIGSTLSSVLDSFLKGAKGLPIKKKYYMKSHRQFLLNQLLGINELVVTLNGNFEEKYLIPFKGFERKILNSVWWNAYNSIKHTDIYSLQNGCLSNVIYGFSALTILDNLIRWESMSSWEKVRKNSDNIILDIRIPKYDLKLIEDKFFPIVTLKS